ncbi:MAG: exosortase/archaeosortase family protein [Curvibacter sp.]|jgi:exosortase/archaeosortase family protein|nr:MAG: exosortase/archaeosortase family protein [Curvibacter sp.]
MREVDTERATRRPVWVMALAFVIAVVALQWAWGEARGTVVERAVIEQATVGTAVAIINAWTPEVQASPAGSRIKAPGGGINILNGCEGTEVLFLLVAALLAYPMSWRWRAIGTILGTAFVFVLNQVRLLALFYSYRSDRALFDQLHGLVAPMMLIALSLGFMVLVIRWDERGRLASLSRADGVHA